MMQRHPSSTRTACARSGNPQLSLSPSRRRRVMDGASGAFHGTQKARTALARVVCMCQAEVTPLTCLPGERRGRAGCVSSFREGSTQGMSSSVSDSLRRHRRAPVSDGVHAFARPVSRACGGLQRAVRPPWLAGSPRRTARTREGLRGRSGSLAVSYPRGDCEVGSQRARPIEAPRASIGAPSCKGQHCTTEVSLTMYASRTCAGRPRPLPPSGTRTAYARRCNSQLDMTPPRAGGRWRRHWAGCTVREYTPVSGADAALAGVWGCPQSYRPRHSQSLAHTQEHRAHHGVPTGRAPGRQQARPAHHRPKPAQAVPTQTWWAQPRGARRSITQGSADGFWLSAGSPSEPPLTSPRSAHSPARGLSRPPRRWLWGREMALAKSRRRHLVRLLDAA